MAVIAARELDDLVAPGKRARDANGAHRRFGSGADESNALHRWHERAHAFAQLVLERRRCAETGTVSCSGGDRSHQTSRCVAMNQWAPRHDIVDEAIAVDVLHDRTRRTPNEERCAAYCLERPYGAVYSAGQDLAGSQEELLATRRSFHDMRNIRAASRA